MELDFLDEDPSAEEERTGRKCRVQNVIRGRSFPLPCVLGGERNQLGLLKSEAAAWRRPTRNYTII